MLAAVLWPEVADLLRFPPGAALARWGRFAAETLATLAVAWLLVRSLDRVFWRGAIERKTGSPAPRLLVDIVAALVWVGAVVTIVAWVFDAQLVGLLATSSVTLAVVGFALRDIIASLFAGMALSLEHPYAIGDWIEVEVGSVARVEQVGWLTTRAVTRDGIGIVIPNARLTATVWRNYTRPSPLWRDSIRVTLDERVPGDVVERVLLAAMHEVPEVDDREKRPDVKIAEFGDRGIVWLARYWVADYAELQEVRYSVQRAVLRHLHYAGIDLARPRLDSYVRPLPPAMPSHAIICSNCSPSTSCSPAWIRPIAHGSPNVPSGVSATEASRSCGQVSQAARCSSWSRDC